MGASNAEHVALKLENERLRAEVLELQKQLALHKEGIQ